MLKKKEETTILFIRGISLSNKKFLEKTYKKLNYRTVGELLNAIIDDVKKEQK